MILESTFQKIKKEADIVKIISEYIKLEKKSSNYVGLCPFHPDQNPSLNVSPSKKIYKCFSCGAAGDVFKFVKEYERIPFNRAVQIVGEKCGISVKLGNEQITQVYTKYYNILDSSTNFYHFLLENTVSGENAKKYLYKRNLSDEIIKRFKIGISPNESDLLYKSLLDDNYQPLDMIEAGVVRGTNNYTDVFRNRIMFPLDDINGKIIGFSGRVYSDFKKEEPKYLNSAENKIFKKGNILYNFSIAQNNIRNKDHVFVFEGFMDVFAAYRCNIHNAVATMGTSLSINQINSLKKITNNIVICFDGDTPGIEASKKAILQFLKNGLNVMALLLPKDMDPDDYINTYGEKKLEDFLLNSQISGYDYLYETSKAGLSLDNLNNIEIFKNEIFDYLGIFKSNVLNDLFFEKLAKDINVSVESLYLDFEKKPVQRKQQIEYRDDSLPDISVKTTKQKPTLEKKKYINASKSLIKIAYGSKEKCNLIKFRLNDKFVDKTHNSLLEQIYNYYSNHDEMASDVFKKNLSPVEIDTLTDILNSNYEIKFIQIEQSHIDEYIRTINSFYDEEYLKHLRKHLSEDTDDKTLNEYLETKKRLTKLINKKE